MGSKQTHRELIPRILSCTLKSGSGPQFWHVKVTLDFCLSIFSWRNICYECTPLSDSWHLPHQVKSLGANKLPDVVTTTCHRIGGESMHKKYLLCETWGKIIWWWLHHGKKGGSHSKIKGEEAFLRDTKARNGEFALFRLMQELSIFYLGVHTCNPSERSVNYSPLRHSGARNECMLAE